MRGIYMLMLVSMTLTLMRGHSWLAKEKIQGGIILTTKLATSIKLKVVTAVGHFFYMTLSLQIFIWVDLVLLFVFADLLIETLFKPGSHVNPDHKHKYTHLLAYAVSVHETFKKVRGWRWNGQEECDSVHDQETGVDI